MSYDPSEALYVGEPINFEQLYMSGGGYVLSRAALDKFIQILKDPRNDTQVGCDRRRNLQGEDAAMGTKESIKIVNNIVGILKVTA